LTLKSRRFIHSNVVVKSSRSTKESIMSQYAVLAQGPYDLTLFGPFPELRAAEGAADIIETDTVEARCLPIHHCADHDPDGRFVIHYWQAGHAGIYGPFKTREAAHAIALQTMAVGKYAIKELQTQTGVVQ
jgi:hypothetical protein